jgi:uncharacterized protein YbjT (DUF2867 family)
MTQKIAVVGATGRVGRHVVDVVRERGFDAVPIARSLGVDVITGEGLDGALEGVTCVVDAATGPSPVEAEATAFFTTAAANLASAAARAGVSRVVVVSIIGIDKFSAGYNAAKLAHERAWLANPIDVRVLRAAQFHEFVGQLLQWGRRGDVAYLPAMRTQLVAARSVAEALVDLALDDAPAGGPIWEVAGPREERLVEMGRLLAAHDGDPVGVEEGTDPSDPDAPLYLTDALLPGPNARLSGPTYADWLAAA